MACEKYTNCEYCKEIIIVHAIIWEMEVLGVKNFNAQ